MLGYRAEESPGRAVMEALGHGLEVGDDEVLAFAALRYTERRDGALWATGRPAADDPTAPRALAEARRPRASRACGLEVEPLGPPARPGEGILRVTGGAHDGVTDSDPFFRDRQPVMRPAPLVPEAAATARAAEAWTRATVRPAAGGMPGTRGHAEVVGAAAPGAVVPRAPRPRRRHRRRVAVPRRPRPDARHARSSAAPEVDEPAAALRDRARARPPGARRRRHLRASAHLKATDEAGHTKDPRGQARDDRAHRRRAWPTPPAPLADAVVCVTGDHATPTSPEVIHSGDPVPFLMAGPGVRADRVVRFGELDCGDGILGRLRGGDVMPLLLNAADRPALPRLAADAGARRPAACRPRSSRCRSTSRPGRPPGSRRSSPAGSPSSRPGCAGCAPRGRSARCPVALIRPRPPCTWMARSEIAHQRLVAPGLQRREVAPLGRAGLPLAQHVGLVEAGQDLERQRPHRPPVHVDVAEPLGDRPEARRSACRRPAARARRRPTARGSGPPARCTCRRAATARPVDPEEGHVHAPALAADHGASGPRRTPSNSSTPVWPSAMIVCCTGPRAAPGASSAPGRRSARAAAAPSTRATTWACSTKGAPVIRCFVPLSAPAVAVAGGGRGLEGEGVAAGPRLGQGEGDVRAAGEEVRPASRSRAAPVQWRTSGLGPSVQASIHWAPRSPWR